MLSILYLPLSGLGFFVTPCEATVAGACATGTGAGTVGGIGIGGIIDIAATGGIINIWGGTGTADSGTAGPGIGGNASGVTGGGGGVGSGGIALAASGGGGGTTVVTTCGAGKLGPAVGAPVELPAVTVLTGATLARMAISLCFACASAMEF